MCIKSLNAQNTITGLQISEVEIQDKRELHENQENPLSIINVNAAYLEKFNGNSLIGSLERIPGVSMINLGTNIAKPVIRGLSFNRVIVNAGGVRQEGQQWGADHGLEIDQYSIENVEIVKGAASLQYGSDGMGGVLNILQYKIPKDSSLAAKIVAIHKTNNDLWGLNGTASGRKGNKFFRISITRQDFADYRVPASEFTYNSFVLPIYDKRLKNTAGNETGASLTLGVKTLKGHTQITLSNYYTRFGMFAGALGIPRAYNLLNDGNSRDISLPSQRVNHFKIASNTVLKLSNKHFIENDAGYQYNDREECSNPMAHGHIANSNVSIGLDLHTVSNQLRMKSDINSRWHFTHGLFTQFQSNKRSGFDHLLPNFQAISTGLFSFHQYHLNDGLVASGGLRFDYSQTKIQSYTQPSSLFEKSELRNSAIERSFNNFSGALGLAWKANEKWLLKTNIGKTFKMPTAPELSANGVHHGTFRHEVGNPSLVPEHGYQLDAGLEYFSSKFSFKASPFFNYYKNFIYLSPSATFSSLLDGGQLYKYTQTDVVYSGFEAETEINIVKHFILNLNAEYVYNINLSNKMGLPFTPPATFYAMPELVLIQKKRLKKLSLLFTVQHSTAQFRTDRNELPTNGFTLFHASIQSSIHIWNQKLSISFQANNMADTKYMSHLSRYRILNLPEQGRNFVVILKVDI